MPVHLSRRLFGAAVVSAMALHAGAAERNAAVDNGSWDELRAMIYDNDVAIADGAGVITLDTPYRAHDAAVVPVAIDIVPPKGLKVTEFKILVEENPAPVAATFFVGEPMLGEVHLSTRIRVDAYTNVRVIAEMSDGSLYQTANYVKAAGGCSAPSLKDAEAALANVGKMKVRMFEDVASKLLTQPAQSLPTQSRPGAQVREAQVMVRHPNFSGFQMNQVTQLFIPAYFIDDLEVMQGDEMVFRMEGGISISEDPAIRFKFEPRGDAPLTVRAHDTDGGAFERTFPLEFGT